MAWLDIWEDSVHGNPEKLGCTWLATFLLPTPNLFLALSTVLAALLSHCPFNHCIPFTWTVVLSQSLYVCLNQSSRSGSNATSSSKKGKINILQGIKNTLYSRNTFIFSNSHSHGGWQVLLYPLHRWAKRQEHTAGQWQGWSSSPSLLILDHCIILLPNPVAVSPDPTLESPDSQTMSQASHGELLGLEPP